MHIIFPFRKLSFVIALLSFLGMKAQTTKQIQEITDSYETEEVSKLSEEIKLYSERQKNEITRLISEGYKLTIENENGTNSLLTGSYSNGMPMYTSIHNANEAVATGASSLHTGGALGLNINGENMNAFIWDGGFIRQTHNEFNTTGKVNQVDESTATSGGWTNQSTKHANHVGGTLVAIGADTAAKGMAPLASLNAYVFDDDINEVLDAAQNRGALISNHSYGANPATYPDNLFGAYTGESYNFDNISNQLPMYLSVHSAGNEGNVNSVNSQPLEGNPAYDKLTFRKVTKNSLIVAQAEQIVYDGFGNVSSFTVSGNSSEGPTDDLRIKPDITGVGKLVYSSVSDTNSSYANYSGTSMAAPTVAGTLLLIQQYSNSLYGQFLRGYSIRGLALHTAIDGDGIVGPDARAGWGLINAKAIQDIMVNNGGTSVLEQRFVNNGSSATYTTTVSSDGTQPLKVSISWYDHVSTGHIRSTADTPNNGPKTLVNDLDVRVERNGITYYPWRLTSVSTNANDGDNNRDNFERIDIPNPAAGTYQITVSHKGSITGPSGNFEEYTLIVSGAQQVNLGTKNIENNNNIAIYPNPTKNKVNISIKNSSQKIKLVLLDLQGRRLIEKSLNTNSSNFKTQLNLETLSQGVYTLMLNIDGKLITKKIIKR